MDGFYNESLVDREHKYLCSLKEPNANIHYTTLHSKRAGDVTIDLFGHKSGAIRDFCEIPATKTLLQPSHLSIVMHVHPRLLSDPLTSYRCVDTRFRHQTLDNEMIRFEIKDIDAFIIILHRLDEAFRSIENVVVNIYVDWLNLAALRDKKSACVIQQPLLGMRMSDT